MDGSGAQYLQYEVRVLHVLSIAYPTRTYMPASTAVLAVLAKYVGACNLGKVPGLHFVLKT